MIRDSGLLFWPPCIYTRILVGELNKGKNSFGKHRITTKCVFLSEVEDNQNWKYFKDENHTEFRSLGVVTDWTCRHMLVTWWSSH